MNHVEKRDELFARAPEEARQVLIVEDEGRLRDMLIRAVREMGFEPTAVATGEAALRAAEGKTFDILLLDLNLPGISGLDVLERLRQHQPDVQVIILTGFGDLEAARRAIHLEVVDFLTKPCALGSIEQALDRARRRRLKLVEPDWHARHEDDAEEERPPVQFVPPQPASEGMSLEELEQRHILAVLEKHRGNRAATAAELGISIRKLYYRLGQYQKQGLIP